MKTIPVRLVAFLVTLTMAGPAQTFASVASDITSLTGGRRVKLVWMQDQASGGNSSIAASRFKLMGFDTSGGGERVILSKVMNYTKPLLTRDGARVIFSDRVANQAFVVNFDGAGLRTITAGIATDVWRDPNTGIDWVCIIPKYTGASLVKLHQIDNPAVSRTLWDRTQVSYSWFNLSADGKRAGGCLPHPQCGVATMPNGPFQKYGGGCFGLMAQDDSYRFMHFEGDHRHMDLYDDGGGNKRRILINGAPGVGGSEVYFPMWLDETRYLTMTGPYPRGIGAGGTQVELYFGKFNAGFTGVEQWVKVTSNSMAEAWGDGWIDSGAARKVRIASFAADPGSVLPGGKATLSWATTDATAIRIAPGIGTVQGGSIEVSPAQTTTYTLTADGEGGPVTRQVTVTVTAPKTVTINSFTVDLGGITPGGSTTLRWDTTNATRVTIDQGVGTVGTDGTLQVSPAATTTYTLTAEGVGGPIQIQVIVVVTAPATITILGPQTGDAWPAGSTQSIRWTTENIEAVSIYYSTNGGANWTSIAPTVSKDDAAWGNYAWKVPDEPSPQAKLYIAGYFGEAPTESGLFEITSGRDTTAPTLGQIQFAVGGVLDDPSISVVKINGLDFPVKSGAFLGQVSQLAPPATITLKATDAAGNTVSRLLEATP